MKEEGSRQGAKTEDPGRLGELGAFGVHLSPCQPDAESSVILNNAFGSAFGVRRSAFRKVLRRLIGLSKAHHLGDELVALYGDALQR